MKIANCFLTLALALTIATGALAGDGDKKGEGKGEKKPAVAGEKGAKNADAAKRREAAAKKRAEGKGKARSLAARMLRGIELTKEQKEAMAPTEKEFAPKFAEIRKAQQGIYTEEQRKAQKELFAKLRESGNPKSPEARKQVADVMKLTPEQKEKAAEIRASFGKLREDFLAKVDVILTPEQKEKLKSRRGGGRKPGAGKKPGEGEKKPRPKKGGDSKATEKTAKSA